LAGLRAITAVAALILGMGAAAADEVAVKAALGKRSLQSSVGISSYYGPGFHGRPTADGERFDMLGISAAHKTLPIPSYARVTNLSNGRSMVVRINDRGPYVGGRILDVSVRVARLLGYHGGLERVRLDYLGMAGPQGSDDQRALMATLNTAEPTAVAAVKLKTGDGESIVARSDPALAYSAPARKAPAAAALDAVRAPAPAAAPAPLGLAAKLDASVRQLESALESAHARAAKAASPFGDLVVAPFKPVVQALR